MGKIGEMYPGTTMTLARKAIKKLVDEMKLLQQGDTKSRFKMTEEGKKYFKDYQRKKDGKGKKVVKKKKTTRKKAKRSPKKKTTKRKTAAKRTKSRRAATRKASKKAITKKRVSKKSTRTP